MKILLDENLPHALRRELAGHDVFTVADLGWSGTKNGALLQRAAQSGFAAMLTLDDGVAYQQNTALLPLSILILSAPSNDIDDLLPLVPSVLAKLSSLQPRTISRVP